MDAATPADLALVAAVDAVARVRRGGLAFSALSAAACVDGGFAREATVRPGRAVAFSLSLRTVVRPAARVTRRVCNENDSGWQRQWRRAAGHSLGSLKT